MPYVEVAEQRIILGNCLEVLSGCADGGVDMVFADLPYGVTANKWDTPLDLAALWTELLRVGKRNAAFVFTATQPFATTLINSQPKLFRYDLVWDKGVPTNFAQASFRVMRCHESVLVFSPAGATYGARLLMKYNPQKQLMSKPKRPHRMNVKSLSSPISNANTESYLRDTIYTHSHPRSIVAISSRADRARGMHPAQKPVALLEWLIRTYSHPGDVVLDPTCGSGTTLVACHRTGRRGRGIELDRGYVATAIARLRSETQQLPLLTQRPVATAAAHSR